MLKQKIYLILMFVFAIFCLISNGYCQQKEISWESRHFPNVPRISPEQAMQMKLSGQKIIVVDAAWGKGDYNKGHVCGAVYTKYSAEALDALIKKIPKDYIILAYCK